MEKVIYKALQLIAEAYQESNRHFPDICLNLRHCYSTEHTVLITKDKMSYRAIEDLIKENSSNYYTKINDVSVSDVTDEEWEIVDGKLSVFNEWGKMKIRMKELGLTQPGEYVIMLEDGYESKTVTMKLHESIYDNSLVRDFGDQSLEAFKDMKFKAKDMQIYYVPKYHMIREHCYETYPDDPGCGMASYYMTVVDKATGEPYTQPYDKRS